MKLSELIKTIKVKIPKTDLVIELKTELSWFEWLEYVDIKDDLEKGKFLVQKLIFSWNLTDDNEKVLKITKEVVEKLSPKVILTISAEVTKISRKFNLKKKS